MLKLVKECDKDLSEEEREELFILLLNYADVLLAWTGSWDVQCSTQLPQTILRPSGSLIDKCMPPVNREQARKVIEEILKC